MSRRPIFSLFLTAVAFIAGVGADRLWLGRAAAPASFAAKKLEAGLRPASDRVGTPSALSASSVAATSGAGGTASLVDKRALPQEQAARIEIVPPKNPQPLLEPEKEAQLTDLMQAPLPAMKDVERKSNADGSVDVYGASEDGRDVYRHFNPKGELTREGWTASTGESFYRGFYESGGLKQVSWSRPDHSSSSVSLTQSGLYESRFDQLPDGSTVATVYDDSGQVQEVAHEKSGDSPGDSPAT